MNSLAGLIGSEHLTRWAERGLFGDEPIFATTTPYQRLVVTRWKDDTRLYINGNLQFSSRDEHRYHEALVHPGLATLPGARKVLVLGGGDGMAVREILKYPQVESITLVDHHKSAIEDLQELRTAAEGRKALNWFCDLEASGAMLAWRHCFGSHEPPRLLGHVQDRDLWRFKLEGTREISAFIFSHEYTFEQWDNLMSADQVELLKMTAAGAAIERKHHKDVAELVKVCQRRMVIGGHDVPVASLPYTMGSDAGHVMAQGEKFSGYYWDTASHRCFGLRSTPDGMDVAEIAQQYGGGGHKHASGFRVPRDHELAKS